MLMSCTAALCLLLLLPLLPLVLYRPDLIPHVLFPDRFIALALDRPILPLPPEFQHPSPSNRLPYAAPPPPPPSPADFETCRLGRKLIAVGNCHPPSPPPLKLVCNKAPPSNPPPPPPPPPPSPADSPHFETYRLGRKLIARGNCHPPSPPPLILDCNKAPASNPPSPPPLILDCNKAPASNPPPLLLLLLFLNSSQCLIALGGASRKVHWALGSNIVIKPSRSLVVRDCERGCSKNYLEIFCESLLLIWQNNLEITGMERCKHRRACLFGFEDV